ncbi:DUF732 domain-containing protein [Nonomuraea sp. NPDC049695]|uniref:DUF732 domain-containing protein n=1 Tax=Nonomuraea sp. NPDC049695 TaxID=3154734 RepID=UPI00344AB48D
MALAAVFALTASIGVNANGQANGSEQRIATTGSEWSFAGRPQRFDPNDEQFLRDIHDAGIAAPDEQAIAVGHRVVDSNYSLVQEFGVYPYHVPAFVQAAMNAYRPNEGPPGSVADEQFLRDIHDAGIVAPDGQAIAVGHRVVDSDYSLVQEFGVYSYHVPAFVQAAMNAFRL